MTAGRPRDAVGTKFNGPVMDRICALAPNFANYQEAKAFWEKLMKRRKVAAFADRRFNGRDDLKYHYTLAYDKKGHTYFCWYQAQEGIYLSDSRLNPMEVLHHLAHILQPVDSPLHKGEFGSIFLALIESMFGIEMRGAVRDIMLDMNIKTSTRSPETREKQAIAYRKRLAVQRKQRVAEIIERFTE